MDVLKEASQLGVNLYEEHQRFVQVHPDQDLASYCSLKDPDLCSLVPFTLGNTSEYQKSNGQVVRAVTGGAIGSVPILELHGKVFL